MTKIVFLRPKIKIPEPMPREHHGIGYMAALLRKHGHEVHFIDCAIMKESYPQIRQKVERLNPDVIGITAVSAYYTEMKKLAKVLHKLKIPIILGGVHVTALPELSLKETGAELAVLGEGELTALELMDTWEDKEKRKAIKGIAYIEDNQFKKTSPRELIEDLDILPIPAWDLMPPKSYPAKFAYFKFKRYPVAAVFTSRGCPHICSFCASTNFWKHHYRRRSPKLVVDEMEMLIKEFGVREIQIGDDYFNCNRKHVIDICREIARRKLNAVFSCPNGLRIENLDEKLLTIMRKTGFYQFTIALESGSQSILNSINKKLDLKRIYHAVKLAKKLGFFVRGYIMFGLPGETYETVRRTIQVVKKLPYDIIATFIARPLPGSSWWNQIMEDKEVSEINYEWFNFVEIKNVLEYSDGKRTIKLPIGAYREHIFRPRQLLRYLKNWVHTFHFNLSVIGIIRRLIIYTILNIFSTEKIED